MSSARFRQSTRPEEVAAAILRLLSEDASYAIGSFIGLAVGRRGAAAPRAERFSP